MRAPPLFREWHRLCNQKVPRPDKARDRDIDD